MSDPLEHEESHIPAARLAEALGLSIQTLANWRSKGRGPAFVRLGGKIVYLRDDVYTWLDSRRVEPAGVK